MELGSLSLEIGRLAYVVAGMDPRAPRGAAVLARRILGPSALLVAVLPIAEAALTREPSGPRITLREGLSLPRMNFLIAHELAHHLADDRRELVGMSWAQRERLCDAAAAWMVAPPEDFVRRAVAYRSSVPALARGLCIPETCAALRLAEVGGPGTAVVTPARIHRRGFSALTDAELRSPEPVGPGVRRVRITDEPRRFALVLAG